MWFKANCLESREYYKMQERILMKFGMRLQRCVNPLLKLCSGRGATENKKECLKLNWFWEGKPFVNLYNSNISVRPRSLSY